MSVVTCTVSNCIKIYTSFKFVQISLEYAFYLLLTEISQVCVSLVGEQGIRIH